MHDNMPLALRLSSKNTENRNLGCCNISDVVKVGAIVIASSTGVAYIAPAMDFAGKKRVFGYLLGACEYVAIFSLNSWLFLDIINEVRKEGKKQLAKKLLMAIIPTLGGAVSGFPSVVIAVRYNQNKKYLAAFSYVGDVISNTYGLTHILSNLLHLPKVCNKESDVELRRQILISLIKFSKSIVRNAKGNHKVARDIIEALRPKNLTDILYANEGSMSESSLVHADDLVINCIAKAATTGSEIYIKRHRRGVYVFHYGAIKKLSSVIFTIGGLVLPWAWLPTAYKLVHEPAVDICDDWFGDPRYSPAAISGMSVAPIYLMEYFMIKNISSHLYDKTVSIGSGTYEKDYSEAKYRILYYGLTLLSFAISALSFATSANVVFDSYSGDISMAMALIVSALIIIFRGYALVSGAAMTLDKIVRLFPFASTNIVNEYDETADRLIDCVEHAEPTMIMEVDQRLPAKIRTGRLAQKSQQWCSFFCDSDDEIEPSVDIETTVDETDEYFLSNSLL